MAVDLARILEMLQERSQRGRNLVFRHVADLFLGGTVPDSSDDRAALVEILRILRPRVDIGIRRELSGHLYSMAHPPEALLGVLLEDVDEVSGPLLDYAVIPQAMMARLIEEAPIEVISRLKRRHDLPAEVRARIDKRFAEPQPTRQAASPPEPEPMATAAPEAPAQPEHKQRAAPHQHEPGEPVPAPVTEKAAGAKAHRPVLQAPYYPDIAALGETVADMAQHRAELRDFVRASSEWQWEVDREGRITYLSDSAAMALGRPVSALLERPFMEVLRGAENITTQDAALAQILDRRSAFDDLSVATQGFDGSCAWKLAAVPLFDLDSGRFQGYRGIAEAATTPPALGSAANSNTPARPAQADTAEPGFDRGVADAIQGLSHELRTPLNAVLGFSEMIELETWGKINDDYRRCVGNIIEAAKQLNELISDILENAKLQSQSDGLYPKSFSISSAIEEAIEGVADQARRRRITIETPAKGLRAIVYSDPRLVHYAVVRLLRCALEDAAPESPITLALTTRDDGSVDIDIPFRSGADRTAGLSALSRFRVNLAKELAAMIGATVGERATRDGHVLSLRLPPHDQFPVSDNT